MSKTFHQQEGNASTRRGRTSYGDAAAMENPKKRILRHNDFLAFEKVYAKNANIVYFNNIAWGSINCRFLEGKVSTFRSDFNYFSTKLLDLDDRPDDLDDVS